MKKANTIATSINQVVKTYNNTGFNVQNIMADGQFKKKSESSGLFWN